MVRNSEQITGSEASKQFLTIADAALICLVLSNGVLPLGSRRSDKMAKSVASARARPRSQRPVWSSTISVARQGIFLEQLWEDS